MKFIGIIFLVVVALIIFGYIFLGGYGAVSAQTALENTGAIIDETPTVSSTVKFYSEVQSIFKDISDPVDNYVMIYGKLQAIQDDIAQLHNQCVK